MGCPRLLVLFKNFFKVFCIFRIKSWCSSGAGNIVTNNVLAFKLVARKLKTKVNLKSTAAALLYCNMLIQQGRLLPAFEDLCPEGSFAKSLRFIPKGQMLNTQTDGMDHVIKMEAVCVVEILNARAFSVSCHDWQCYLFKLFFPRRLLENYFVVLTDTFKLSITIILTLIF